MEKEHLIISFNYLLEEEYNKPLHLEAVAETSPSKSYFRIHSFRIKSASGESTGDYVLPPIEIKRVEKEGKKLWIHPDSEKESRLSTVIGKAIEEKQNRRFLKKV